MGTMAEANISAEVEPQPAQTRAAAVALQRLGFRIFHIGQTISVQGSQALWQATFNVSFKTRKKRTIAEVEGSTVSYHTALTGAMRVPEELNSLIATVSFVEPPEFF